MPSIIVRLGRSKLSPLPRVSLHDRWLAYERAKKRWDATFPRATPVERDAAIVEIARQLGV